MFYLYVPLRTLIPSYFTRVHSYSLVSYSCSLYFTRVLLLFTLPFVFYSYSLVFPLLISCSTHVHSYSLVFYSCPPKFTRVHWSFACVHRCSLVFHSCSLVFIGVHWCSFVFPFVWCFRLDPLRPVFFAVSKCFNGND